MLVPLGRQLRHGWLRATGRVFVVQGSPSESFAAEWAP